MSKSTVPAARIFTSVQLEKDVLLPGDNEYEKRQHSFWSLYASDLRPASIVCPTSATELSTIITTLVRADQKFAVRSGGHTQWSGANNIEGGVTIDLQYLNRTDYDATTDTIDIGPGARWKDVYTELERHGRIVAGGRNGKVGVGGLLLGGGQTFFTGSRGLACDDVVAYEVVLADGNIVTAGAHDDHRDLFKALKGGSGNFGIVTNFKMQCFPCEKIWGGFRILTKTNSAQALEALEEFTANSSGDVNSNLLLIIAYMVHNYSSLHVLVTLSSLLVRYEYTSTFANRYQPDQKDIVISQALIQVDAVQSAPAYKQLLSIPSIMDTCNLTTIKELVSQYDPVPSGWYNCFYTLSVKNDIRIFEKAVELHNQIVDELKILIPDGNFLTECMFQPLPKIVGQKSAERGGSMMGLDTLPVDCVLWVGIIIVKTVDQERIAYPKLQAWGEAVREFAESFENGLFPWVYMNYADATQQPLKSYGPENVRYLKTVAAKYDPTGVFQKLSRGGFKISQVQS